MVILVITVPKRFLRFKTVLAMYVLSVGLLSSCGNMMSTTELHPETKERVVKAPSSTKEELYVKANYWMIETFNNAESVIQFQDKEIGVLMGKYLMETIKPSTQAPSEYVYAFIKIMVKEGAAKIVIKPDSYRNINVSGKGYPLKQANYEVDYTIASFTKAMQAPPDDF